jgi:hypothetical protein
MKTLKICSPYDYSLIKEIPLVVVKEVEETITTAYELFNDRSKWLPAYERMD